MAIAGLENVLRNISFFDLNGRMVDVEALTCYPVDARQKFGTTQAVVLCNHVTAHGKHA